MSGVCSQARQGEAERTKPYGHGVEMKPRLKATFWQMIAGVREERQSWDQPKIPFLECAKSSQ